MNTTTPQRQGSALRRLQFTTVVAEVTVSPAAEETVRSLAAHVRDEAEGQHLAPPAFVAAMRQEHDRRMAVRPDEVAFEVATVLAELAWWTEVRR